MRPVVYIAEYPMIIIYNCYCSSCYYSSQYYYNTIRFTALSCNFSIYTYNYLFAYVCINMYLCICIYVHVCIGNTKLHVTSKHNIFHCTCSAIWTCHVYLCLYRYILLCGYYMCIYLI